MFEANYRSAKFAGLTHGRLRFEPRSRLDSTAIRPLTVFLPISRWATNSVRAFNTSSLCGLCVRFFSIDCALTRQSSSIDVDNHTPPLAPH